MIVSVCLHLRVHVFVCLCVSVCVCVCMGAYVCTLHIHTSEFKCTKTCQGLLHSTDIQIWRFDTKQRLANI